MPTSAVTGLQVCGSLGMETGLEKLRTSRIAVIICSVTFNGVLTIIQMYYITRGTGSAILAYFSNDKFGSPSGLGTTTKHLSKRTRDY